MKYRVNPKNGDKLSILGFGCMRFAGDGKLMGKFDEQKAENMLKTAIDKGVNYFDTAYIYTGSEETLGKTLKKYELRKDVYIATKLPLIMCRNASDLDKFFDRQLERLQTDYIDYYFLHMLSDVGTWETLRKWGIEEWIQKKKESGQIRQFGFSFHGSREAFLSLLDVYDWDIVTIQYNYSDENYQAGVTGLKKAAEKGIAVVIMEPLLGGKLANLPQKAVEHFKKANPERTQVEWALKWLWNQPEVTCVLSGMSQPEQVDENIIIAENSEPGMLSDSETETFREVGQIFRESFKIPCTGCGYCIPCPFGVDIPGCFSSYNTSCSISKSQGRMQYMMATMLSAKPSYAGLCKKCGKCEKHCPQNIPIVKHLEEVKKNMEGVGFRLASPFVKLFTNKK